MSGGGLPALEFWGIALGLREAVILLILLVTLYMFFVLLRMRRLRSPSTAARPETPAPTLSVAAPEQQKEDAAVPAPVVPPEASEEDLPLYTRTPVQMADQTPGFGMAQELAQLREEVDAVRGELAALRQDMQQEIAHLHSAQSVSPIYGDAMQMAIAGYDPVMIADRCGIARAEAELVVALAKSQGSE